MRAVRALAAALLLAVTTAAAAMAAPEPTPSHYYLKGTIQPKTGVMTARLTITLQPQDVVDDTAFLLGARFNIRRADAGPGVKVTSEPLDLPPLGKLTRLKLAFAKRPTRPVILHIDYAGPLRAADDPDGNAYSAKLMELRLEETWLPVRSDLSLAFTADVDLKGVTADRVAVAQGQVSHRGDRLRIHRDFADSDLPIVAAPGLKKFVGPDIEIYALDLDSPLIRVFEKHGVQALAFDQKLFGPLPVDGPVRIVASPRTKGSAYARKGFISSSDGADEIKAHPDFDPATPAATIAHEFSHAWWWAADPFSENYWLAESMAEYSSMRYIEHAFGPAKLETFLVKKRKAAKDSGPILAGKRATRAALYQRGPLLLFDLQEKIGRAKMDELLGVLGRDPPHVTGDFLQALSAVAGEDVAKDFEAKLRAS
jgi:aminopeptidase N